jgi:hypothetical protein
VGIARNRSIRVSTRVIAPLFGVLGTGILHLTIVLPSWFGELPLNSRASLGAEAQGTFVGENESESIQLIDLSGLTEQPNLSPPEVSGRQPLIADMPIKIVAPDPLPTYVEPASSEISDSVVASADSREPSAEDALIFSRYLAQVSARVYRSWSRPRTLLATDMFECSVRIEQDRAGFVQSVELQRCNGDSNWQESLLFAIERASPLSAPPTQTSFSRFLDLTFSSPTYTPGISNESEFVPVAVASTRQFEPRTQ